MHASPGSRMFTAPALLYLAAVVAGTAAILTLSGRHLWCPIGDLVPWSWNTESGHNSQHLLDPYSFTHVEHGIVFFAALSLLARRTSLRARLLAAVTIAGAWEVVENSSFIIERYRAQTIDAGYYGDSILNSLADMGWCALGFIVTSRVPWWASVGIMIAFEIGLAITIRDGLLLNVVMLIYPFDSVLAWQSGR
ncbi:MAG TPA: DUF2585 family protein [Kofleriaceae bacterium]|nr:DUF2585 family protein [Kofleriaceae bacterium]